LSQESPAGGVSQSELLALVADLRPELHRYCARLTGSVIDGEDVVQDALVKALAALKTLEAGQALRAWLFRIAHNQALDLLRSRALRAAEPLDAAAETADSGAPDQLETLMRQEAVRTAVSRFVELPTVQRSVVILKDVLGESLEDIAALLDTTVNAVKGHLARGRARLKEINARASPPPVHGPPSAAVARFVALFNQRDWEGLRALLADDVRLRQSTHPVLEGAARVGVFFTYYSQMEAVRLAPAWLDGRQVIAVFEEGLASRPSYLMWLEWRDGRITFIRDYRYVRYVAESAELVLAEDPPASGGRVVH
jgi:RNA polymerase sigma factor (sigma-70 family)